MRQLVQKPGPLSAPGVEHRHVAELEAVDRILRAQPDLARLVPQDLTHGVSANTGRKGVTAEQVPHRGAHPAAGRVLLRGAELQAAGPAHLSTLRSLLWVWVPRANAVARYAGAQPQADSGGDVGGAQPNRAGLCGADGRGRRGWKTGAEDGLARGLEDGQEVRVGSEPRIGLCWLRLCVRLAHKRARRTAAHIRQNRPADLSSGSAVDDRIWRTCALTPP
jgi:hypothetical protein